MTDFDDPDFDYDGQGKSKYEDAMGGTYALGFVLLFGLAVLVVVAGVLIWVLS